ncbi:FAD-binding domain-containing protein [Xylariaceae sp. FL0255]|nr:FAD-binding domain-containing protein [Xylariaceae sp. FL0255]
MMSKVNNMNAALGPLLSPDASVILPDDPDFAGLVSRWREYEAPRVSVIVKVATEADVQETVKYAAQHDIPFVIRSGGHGATSALATAKDAIQIDLRLVKQVELKGDGSTATVGGGATHKDVIDSLEELGKRTVTGICESVGFSAVAMGGGHGWLQGQYGLVADQIISARVVLSSGDLLIASAEEHPDLFWALKGAGHNFGIVTEWTVRTFDIERPKLSYEIFIYSGDKLEELYNWANSKLDNQPPEVTHWGYIIKVAEIDPEHPILWFAVIYDGPTETARSYAKPLHDIGPLNVQAGEATIHELAVLSYQDLDGPGCAYGLTSLRYPIGLDSYNISAVRKVYNEIDETFRKVPEIAGSFFLLEGYATQGVRAVDPKTTAFPHRSDKILITSYVQYKPNSTIDSVAHDFGKKLQKYLLEGSDDSVHLRAYVNYANGDESLQAVYGWEDWRLKKLRELKSDWDSSNRMRYYVPIM